MSAFATGAPEDRYLLARIEDIGGLPQFSIVGPHNWLRHLDRRRNVGAGNVLDKDVARNDEDRDAGEIDGGANGDLERARHLFGHADHLAVVAALFEEVLRMRLLKVVSTDLGAGNVR